MTNLGSLSGTLGVANWLNERGEVVGESNLIGDKTFHPFIWREGGLTDIGTLGGDTGIAAWVNDFGWGVGKADLPGPAPQRHDTYLWRHGAISDLGTQDGDPCSFAVNVNKRGQIVGCSSTCEMCLHAFLSERGERMIELNTLIPSGSGVVLTEAVNINERGEIAANATLADGDKHSVLLIPCDSDHPGVDGCDYDPTDLSATIKSTPASTAQGSTSQPRLANKLNY